MPPSKTAAILRIVALLSGIFVIPTAMSTPVPDTIVFNPAVPTLNNPTTPDAVTGSSTLTVTVTAYDAGGNQLPPSSTNPLYIKVYGAPPGVISPTFMEVTSGTTATFTYTGKYFPNNLTVEAWMFDMKAGIPDGELGGPVSGGYAIGVTQIAPQNLLECNYGNQSYSLTAAPPTNGEPPNIPPQQFKIFAGVGYNDPSHAAKNYREYTVDTGSLGVVVPLKELPNRMSQPKSTAGAPVIGPGPKGVRLYTSSGNTYIGYYYLAPVTFKTSNGGRVQTIPLQVLGINGASCGGPIYPCYYAQNPPTPTLQYLGIGFNRENPLPGDLFLSPGQNAFLNIKDSPGRNFITQGYILAQNAPNIILGLTETVASRFNQNLSMLAPNPNLPGEWNDIQGTFSFPDLLNAPEFSGNMLLDVGIKDMLLVVDSSSIPQGAQTQGSIEGQTATVVPAETKMTVTVPAVPPNSDDTPALTYSFKVPYDSWPAQPSPTPPLPVGAPIYVKWVEPTPTPSPAPNPLLFNTGIAPLTVFDYMYNSQCGTVGFAEQQQ